MEDMESYFSDLLPMIIDYGLNILGAVLILILGWGAAKWFSSRVRKSMERSHRIDDTLTPIMAKITKIAILVITILAVLNQFGVQTASIIAILGAAGLAIGFALQGTLSNIASGMMLLILRPFKVGEVVEIGGTMGVVDEIGLFITEMHTFDNIFISTPNSQVWGNEIKNYSRNEIRRVDMVMGIGYDDDMYQAMAIIREEINNDDRILSDPEPLLEVGELADSSVNIYVRPWVKTPDVWPVRYALTKKLKERFDEEGISIPYPQRDIHLHQNSAEMA
jgi:small conductance mechanosensitive channel